MTETIRYSRIYQQDLDIGTGTGQVQLADGRVTTLDQINLDLIASDIASRTSTPVLPYKVLSTGVYSMQGYRTFAEAVAAIGSDTRTLIVPIPTTIESSITVPSNVELQMVGTGAFSVNASTTLTLNCKFIAPMRQVFSGSGTTTGSLNAPAIYPQWWGAAGDGTTDDTDALQAAIDAATNRRVVIPSATYSSGLLTISNSVEITGMGLVTLSWNAPSAAIRIDADITWLRLSHFKISGSGVLGDAQYGVLANGASRVITDCYIENVTVSNCMVGFELSSAKKLVMIAPKVLTTLGGASGTGYGILIGFGGSNRNEDCYILAPYLYRTMRHGIYISGARRAQVVAPIFYQHRYGESGNIDRAALATSRGENVTITNPQFIECTGEIFSFDDDNILTGGASMLQMNGGFSISPQGDGGSIRIEGGTTADQNIAKVMISNFFLDCNSTYSEASDIRIYDAVDVVITGVFFSADKSYTGDRAMMLVQNTGSVYDGSVFIHGNAGHISGSGNKRFVNIANSLESGTRSVRIFNNTIEGLSTDNLNGLIYAGSPITNTNIQTDSIQEIEITGETPTVSHGKRFRLTQSGATNVTNFLGGYEGHRISIRFIDGNSTIKNTNIYTAGAADFTGTASDMLMLEYRNGAWRELCRSVN